MNARDRYFRSQRLSFFLQKKQLIIKEVYFILDQTPIRGQIRNYDPSFYDIVDAERYGGFLENHDFQATRTRFNPNNQQPYSGNYNNRGGGGGNHMNYPPNPGPMPTTTKITIPNSLFEFTRSTWYSYSPNSTTVWCY